MNPHIVRHLDKTLLKKAVALYQKKYSEINEDDWNFIMEYRDLVRLSILHIHPPIKDLKHIEKSAEVSLAFVKQYEDEFNENFQKRFDFYVRMLKRDNEDFKLKNIMQLKTDIANGHWDKVFSLELPIDIQYSVMNLYWVKLFSNIDFNENWMDEINNRFKYILEKTINSVFLKDEKKKIELIALLNDSKDYALIIEHICKFQNSYNVLALFPEVIRKLNRENAQPSIFLASLLRAQQIFHENRQKSLFLRDAKRGTTIADTNITSDLKSAEEKRNKMILKQVVDELNNRKVRDNLIKYILLYAHQDGISQSGSNFFQRENINLGFSFLANDKQVRIEVISPAQIRVVSPVICNSYSETSDQIAGIPKQFNKSIYYEFTSILIEDDSNNNIAHDQLGVKVSIDDCFYEATNDKLLIQVQTAIFKKVISKQNNKKELEKYEIMLLQPYITESQGLTNLLSAPAGLLVVLMLSNYKYAIEIMQNEKLRDKILNSEFSIHLFDVFNLHVINEQFLQNDINKLWVIFDSNKKYYDMVLAISNELIKLSSRETKPVESIKIYRSRLIEKQKSVIALLSKQQYLYDTLRTYSKENRQKLLALPEINKMFNSNQLNIININQNDNLTNIKDNTLSASDISQSPQNLSTMNAVQIGSLYALDLTATEYRQLAELYIKNKEYRKIISSHPVLLKKIIENANIDILNEMLINQSSLVTDIIQVFNTNVQFRDKFLGKIATSSALPHFIANILANIQVNELDNLIQIINACEPRFDFFTIVKDNPIMLTKDEKSITQLFDVSKMSHIKQFLAMKKKEQDEMLNDHEKMIAFIENALPSELNILFSSHPNVLRQWITNISAPNNSISNEIRKAIMFNLDNRELIDMYLYTDPTNKIIILANKHLIEHMFTDQVKLVELYIHDRTIRPIIENNDAYVNFMMSADYSGRVWFEIYLNASQIIRHKIIANDEILDKIVLMTSQNNLLQIIKLQPELTSKVMQKIFQYYLETEYMKWIVNRQPELLHEMIKQLDAAQVTSFLIAYPNQVTLKVIEDTKKLDILNIDQIILLLSDTKSPIYNLLLNNKACCTIFAKSELSLQSQVPQQEKIIKDILDRYPDLHAVVSKKSIEQNRNVPPEILEEISKAKSALQTKVRSSSNDVKKDGPNLGIKSS